MSRPSLPPITRSLRDEIHHLRKEVGRQKALVSYYKKARDRLIKTLEVMKMERGNG